MTAIDQEQTARTTRNRRQRRDRVRAGGDGRAQRRRCSCGRARDASAERAARDRREDVREARRRGVDPERVQVVDDLDALADATFVVEAVVEDHDVKAAAARPSWPRTPARGDPRDHHLVAVGRASWPRRAAAPSASSACTSSTRCTRMELVELAFPREATAGHARARARAVRGARQDRGRGARHPGLRRQPAAVPVPVQRRRLLERDRAWSPEAIDTCMKLGAGHPMGPLALLDFVGLDVSMAIGEAIGADVPAGAASTLVAEGALGRKSGAGSSPTTEPDGAARDAAAHGTAGVPRNYLASVQVEPHPSWRDVPHSSTSSPEARSRPVPSGPAPR